MLKLERTILDAGFLFCCSLMIFTLGLRHEEIIGFESRFYLFALEMWRHGSSWFPMLYQQAYPDYPGTSTLLIYLGAKLFGGLNKFTAVLPSAIAAATTLSATYLIGALHARRIGWYAVGLLLCTNAFLLEARTISLDMFVTACTTLGFYLAYSAQLKQKSMPIFFLSCILVISFLVRGPIGLIIPASVLCVFYGVEKETKKFFLMCVVSFMLLISLSALLLMLAHHVGGMPFVERVLHLQIWDRMQKADTPHWYYYFVESIGAYAVSYPLAILALLALLFGWIKLKTQQERKLILLLLSWVLIILLGLSVPAVKKIRYILPIAPALALISSYLFSAREKMQHVQNRLFFFVVVILVGINIFVVEPINLRLNQTHAFVAQVEKLRAQQQAELAFYQQGADGLVIKYLVNMPIEGHPLFVSDRRKLPSHTFIIAFKENFPSLANDVHVIARGKIGHEEVVVFVSRL